MQNKLHLNLNRFAVGAIMVAVAATAAITWAATGGGWFFKTTEAKGLVGHWPLDYSSKILGGELFASFVNHPTAYPYETLSSSGRDITSAINTTGSGAVMSHTWGAGTISITTGDRYLFTGTLTLNSGEAPFAQITDTPWNNNKSGEYTLSAGYNEFVIVATGTEAAGMVFIGNYAASNWSMTSVSLRKITSAQDTSGYGNHGTLYGMPAFTTDQNSQSNKAMSFDDTDDYIATTYQFPTGSAAKSFSAWFKTSDISNRGWIISGGANTNAQAFGLFFVNDNTLSFHGNGASYDAVFSAAFANNVFYHVTVTYDGTDVRGYVNGALDVTKTAALNTSAANVLIGRRIDPISTEYFNGVISDVRAYDRALSAAEVSDLYQAYQPLARAAAQSKGLIGQWMLDSASEVQGPELLTDANAASDPNKNEANATTGWTGTATPTSSGTGPYAGAYQMDVTGNAAGFLSNDVAFVSGKRYRLSYAAQVISGSGLFHVSEVYGYGWFGNRIELDGFDGTAGWHTDEIYFNANATAVALNLWLQATPTEYYIDNLSLKEVRAADATPYANDGVVYGAAYTTDQKGQSNRAMDFDGTDDYIDLKSGKLSEDNKGTITAWVKMDSGTTGAVFGYGGTSGGNWPLFRAGISGNEIFLGTRVNGSDYEYTNAQTTLTNGTWYHLAWVSDGSTWYLYVNGQSESYTMGFGTAGDWFYDITEASGPKTLIGAWFDGNSYQNRIDGAISDVRIYNRALSAAEVDAIYNSYRPKASYGSLAKGLVGEWSLQSRGEVMGANAETDGTMEVDSGWFTTGTPSTQERSSADKYSGAYSRHVIGATNGDGFWSGTDWVITTGKTYRLNFWYKVVSGTLKLIVKHGNQTYSLYINDALTGNTWQEFSTLLTDTEGGVNGSIWFTTYPGAAEFYIDDVSWQELHTADATPYGNDGTVYGATVAADSTTFDGSNDYIDLPTTTGLPTGATPSTVSMWVKPDTGYGGLLAWGSTVNLKARIYGISTSGYIEFAGYANDYTSSAQVSLNEWNHVTAVYDGSTTQYIYINGVLKDTHSITQLNTALGGYHTIGTPAIGGEGYFKGSLSGVRIYNRALSADEVGLLYSRGR